MTDLPSVPTTGSPPSRRLPRPRTTRLALRGLGAPARTLQNARAALALWSSNLERTDVVPPP
ncbi:hypothetical protein [Lentzea sp.]|uniref:hypothetical protein n=1 Tax=Lentzea sp. TaxID=56099 RepID=UPI002ED0997E